MNFFRHHLQVPYAFVQESGQPAILQITDITLRSKVAQRIQSVTDTYYDYLVKDHERPDTVSMNVYGHPRYTWLVLLLNNMMGLYDWPMNYDEFQRFIIGKYGSLSVAQQTTTESHYYFTAAHVQVTATAYAALAAPDRGAVLPARYCFDANGAPIDPESYDALSAADQGVQQTPYEYELDRNEEKRAIKVVSAEFLPAIDREYQKLFRRS